MEFLNRPHRPETAEIHVKVTRQELERLLYDVENETHLSDFYSSSQEFVNYLRSL